VEYDRNFGSKLAETAQAVVTEGVNSLDAQRTILYLSLLSTDISMKALLERAGVDIPVIRSVFPSPCGASAADRYVGSAGANSTGYGCSLGVGVKIKSRSG